MLFKLRVFLFALTGLLSISVEAALPVYDTNGKALPSLSSMLKKVNPAVVNISTFATQQAVNNPLLNDPFFRHFFQTPNQQQQQQRKYRPKKRQQSAGSGVIVDKENGIVITNHHVINNADEVHVALIDGRSFLAEVIGHDSELDIAVLKIKAKNLQQVHLADSDQLEVGDFAVAIGNPFGLGQTVTTGIVSALGRTGLGIEGYENFIQTDASINPGNSGGALVNLNGHLIGINTAIIAPAGGNVGIGFAIPINMVKSSMGQILKHGEVKRGKIGVMIQDITPELSKAFDLKNGQRGVLLSSIVPNSSAENAGLKQGDIVISINGKKTTSTGKLRTQVAMKAIGEEITVGVIRDGNYKEFEVEVSQSNLEKKISQRYKLLEGVQLEKNIDGKGVMIVGLTRNSIAAYSGLRRGDIIVGANKKRVVDINDLNQALKQAKNKVLLHINRNGRLFYLVIR